MKERPILFSGAMVRALLAGAKTQTRRMVKPQPIYVVPSKAIASSAPDWKPEHDIKCPYGKPGDRLWVRETFAPDEHAGQVTFYRADAPHLLPAGGWKPSIFMPRVASRITLEITKVRIERLQDITRGDAIAEGCPFPNMAVGPDPRRWYEDLWTEINKPGSWNANPWVWCLDFKQVAA